MKFGNVDRRILGLENCEIFCRDDCIEQLMQSRGCSSDGRRSICMVPERDLAFHNFGVSESVYRPILFSSETSIHFF